ncbi:MAG: hypothetical protein Q8J78_05300 [Moraxellaceae bacterium]|nr:hypothetical protein [Moraxellaceae bacterium]
MFNHSLLRALSAPLLAALLLTGCNNDTGSNELPGGGHDHDHEPSVSVKKIGTPLRVTQVDGHHDVTQLAAFATGNKVLYLITPERNLYEVFDWANGDATATRKQHGFDGHGEHFLVLDTNGMLHIIETGTTAADWTYKAGVQVVSAASISAGAKFTVSAVEDKVFITDPDPAYAADTGKIQVVDLDAGSLLTAIDLDFTPSSAGIAWTGVAGEHDHTVAAAAVPPAAHDDHPGRLVLASSTRAYVYDLEEEDMAGDFALDHAPAALYASPGYRYALITQRPAAAAHQVQFIDSGLYAHDDHVHEDAPTLLAFKLFGTTPAHYRRVDGLGALFFDGGSGPRFVLFDDASLAAGRVIASENALAAHHGVAEPRGEVVLVSKPDTSGILVYHRHDDHFHEEGTVDEACTGLHGAGSNALWSGFGCSDGVLVLGVEDDHDH